MHVLNMSKYRPTQQDEPKCIEREIGKSLFKLKGRKKGFNIKTGKQFTIRRAESIKKNRKDNLLFEQTSLRCKEFIKNILSIKFN